MKTRKVQFTPNQDAPAMAMVLSMPEIVLGKSN